MIYELIVNLKYKGDYRIARRSFGYFKAGETDYEGAAANHLAIKRPFWGGNVEMVNIAEIRPMTDDDILTALQFNNCA